MVRRTWLFGLILGVPLVGFLVSQGIQAHFNAELRTALRENVADASPEAIARATVTALCDTSDSSELAELCSEHANIVLLGRGSVWAAALGIALVGGIWIAGTVARSSRRLLVWVFKPGLYVTATILIGLVLAHAVIAMAAIYFGESAIANRIHVGIILAIGLGALAGVVSVARNTFGVVQIASTGAIGVRVGWQQAPQLWESVTALAKRLGANAPQHIVLGLDPNFFVTEAEVRCLGGTLKGRTLYCSLSLTRILTKHEFLSIIGHELGHFRGDDTKFSQRFYPIYRGTADSIAALQRAGGDGSGSIALLPAIAVFGYFLDSFAVAENLISRDRELEADRAGAEASSGPAMATALVKVHAFSGLWSTIIDTAVSEIRRGQVYVNASKLFADMVAGAATREALVGISETHTPHPTDSHPPLAVRLAALKISLDAVADAALIVAPQEPAIALIAEPEQVEEHVSSAYQQLLAHSLPAETQPEDSGTP